MGVSTLVLFLGRVYAISAGPLNLALGWLCEVAVKKTAAGMFAALAMVATCFLSLSTDAAAVHHQAKHGSVCISAVPKPSSGEASLANPAGGGRTFEYAIQFNDGPITPIPHHKGLQINGLSLNRRHLVRIYRDGDLVESFRFAFETYRSRELCLWYKSLYETWSLWTKQEAKDNCDCP
jgi:hypothetical protein